MKSDVICPYNCGRGKKTIEICLEDTVTHPGKDGAVGLIWRQIVESVCVHLHLCNRVVHLAGSDIYDCLAVLDWVDE